MVKMLKRQGTDKFPKQHCVLCPPSQLESPSRVMPHLSPSMSQELLHRLESSNIDRASDVLSELRARGYLEVEGDNWWKAEVLIAMMSRASRSMAMPSFYPLFH